MPSANVMAFAFVTRRADRCDNPESLLQSIHEETEAVRRGQLSRYFIGGLAAVQSAGALDWLLRRPICFSTAVLTNLGDPTRRFVARFPRSAAGLVVGNLVFRGLAGGPPLRPLTRAAFSIFNSAKTLSVSLKSDPHNFSPGDMRRLLDRYLEQLASTSSG